MKSYLDALKEILYAGEDKNDRTGTGTLSLFDLSPMVYDLQKGFPLMTTKKVFLKGVIYELLWMLRGDTNTKYLVDNGVHIWDEWANEDGSLGPVYGAQWRKWKSGNRTYIDQMDSLVSMIRTSPSSRRLIVNAWNVGQLDEMNLPPCHCFFQCYVREGKYLDLKLYQRSADMFLGVPFNIASYSLLCMMLAQQTGLKPGKFIHVLGDAHIYKNHIQQVKTQLERTPFELPRMTIDRAPDLFSYRYEDFHLHNYTFHPAIKGEVSK